VVAVFRPALSSTQLWIQQCDSQETETVEEAEEKRQQRAAEVSKNSAHAVPYYEPVPLGDALRLHSVRPSVCRYVSLGH